MEISWEERETRQLIKGGQLLYSGWVNTLPPLPRPMPKWKKLGASKDPDVVDKISLFKVFYFSDFSSVPMIRG